MQTTTETLDWLIRIETLARDFYTSASKSYSKNKPLSEFLNTLAHDEVVHLDTVLKIYEEVRNSNIELNVKTLPQEVRIGYIREFQHCIAKMTSEEPFSKDELLETIVALECAEWAETLADTLKNAPGKIRAMTQSAIDMEKHRNYVLRYVEKHHSDRNVLKKLPDLPIFWTEKVLVIDNYIHIQNLLKIVLSKKGKIVSASNCKDAMDLIKNNYYAVIISEANGDGINGVNFYKEVIKSYPTFKDRFIFFTSSINIPQINFFKENSIPFLIKPSGIRQLKAAVSEVLAKRV